MSAGVPEFSREQAARLRKLAREIVDYSAQRALIELAEEYEARATEAEVAAKAGRDCDD